MDVRTAQWLTDQTSAFYAQVSSSFDATRQAPWRGWEQLLATLGPQDEKQLRLLDIACGNLRFEKYLFEQRDVSDAWCVDNCDMLAAQEQLSDPRIHYLHLDIAQALLGEGQLDLPHEACDCDLAVCFGFMHHLPLASQRSSLLRALIGATHPGGYVAVSFWQFLRDKRIRAKARSFEGADEGDYLLGWQERTDVARYCHHFDDAEIDKLVYGMSNLAQETCRYSADGRNGDLNRYVILRRRV